MVRISNTYQLLTVLFFLILPSCLVAQSTGWEWDYLRKLQQKRTPSSTQFNRFISDASDPVALAIPATFLLKGLISKNELDKKRGFYFAGSFASNVAITYLLKKSINRKRPGESDPNFTVLTSASSRSFPSGHTSEAFAMATSLSLAFKKWYVIAPAYTFASLVGYSRMYLGAHYPSDVIAGAIVGSGAAWVTYKLNKKWQSRKKVNDRSN